MSLMNFGGPRGPPRHPMDRGPPRPPFGPQGPHGPMDHGPRESGARRRVPSKERVDNFTGTKEGKFGQIIRNKQKKDADKKLRLRNRKQWIRDVGEVRFYCDSCERGYLSEHRYTIHLELHEECQFDGCNLIATPHVLRLHNINQHNTAVNEIRWTTTKEDAKAWIEARKKKYPTTAAIAAKKTVEEDKIKSGAVLKTKQFGKMAAKNRPKKSADDDAREQRDEAAELALEGGEENPDDRKDEESDMEDVEEESETKAEGDKEGEAAPSEKKEVVFKPVSKKVIRRFKRDKSSRREAWRTLPPVPKLLAPEVRHERNMILQCVRHVLVKNFFEEPKPAEVAGKGKAAAAATPEKGAKKGDGPKEVEVEEKPTVEAMDTAEKTEKESEKKTPTKGAGDAKQPSPGGSGKRAGARRKSGGKKK